MLHGVSYKLGAVCPVTENEYFTNSTVFQIALCEFWLRRCYGNESYYGTDTWRGSLLKCMRDLHIHNEFPMGRVGG
jgi:hypothetical protein